MYKIKALLYRSLFALFAIFALGCSSDLLDADSNSKELAKKGGKGNGNGNGGGSSGATGSGTYTVSPAGQYALNVVFFQPTDIQASQQTLDDISDLMLYIQSYYSKQMELSGYNGKTFGLELDDTSGKVNIHLVNGDQNSSWYFSKEQQNPYSTISDVRSDVDDYFNQFPDRKKGTHTVVLAPDETLQRLTGTNDFAYSRASNFSLSPTGKFLDGLELMSGEKLGGLIHELGHGFRVPHNCHKASDLPKIALMSFGNQTYEEGNPDLVKITDATAARLNVCEAFNNQTSVYYSQFLNPIVSNIDVERDLQNGLIRAYGTITSDLNLNHVIIGQDGLPFGPSNNNYDNITYTQGLTATGSNAYTFNISIPFHELFNGYKDENKDNMQFNLHVVASTGEAIQLYAYQYTIDLSTEVPNADVERSVVNNPIVPGIVVQLDFENDLINDGQVSGDAYTSGSAVYENGVVNSSAYVFTGSNSLGLEGYNGINGSEARSVTAWIKSTNTATQGLVHWGDYDPLSRSSFKVNSTGEIRFEWQGGNMFGTTDITDGQWHHVAYTYNGSTVKIYVDGVEENTANVVLDTGNGGFTEVEIGSQLGSSLFIGSLDDVRIYNIALTSAEIATLSGN